MLENLGFTPYEHRVAPWIIVLGILAMLLGFSLFDYVDRNPSSLHSFFAGGQSSGAPASLPEVIRQLRQPAAP